MNTKLSTKNGLFLRFQNNPPAWWKTLKADKKLYIDIRKDNYINVYHNGGSLMRLSGVRKYSAFLHIEYVPLSSSGSKCYYSFNHNNISLKQLKPIDIKNFDATSLRRIKHRIKKFYPNDSEKGIQGTYVTTNNAYRHSNGFFIDTEMAYDDARIDMTWVDLENKKIFFVELKTISDRRLYIDKGSEKEDKEETIDEQLLKYFKFAHKNRPELVEYYDKVFQIKKSLGLLPKYVKEESLKGYSLIEKPILLIGDVTKKWFKNNHEDLNRDLKDIAFGCLYQGVSTNDFRVPYKTERKAFRLD